MVRGTLTLKYEGKGFRKVGLKRRMVSHKWYFIRGSTVHSREGIEPSNSLSSLSNSSGRLERGGKEDRQKTSALQPSSTVSEWIFSGQG